MPSCWEATSSDQQLLLSRHSKRSKESAKGLLTEAVEVVTWLVQALGEAEAKENGAAGSSLRPADATGGRREQSGAAAATPQRPRAGGCQVGRMLRMRRAAALPLAVLGTGAAAGAPPTELEPLAAPAAPLQEQWLGLMRSLMAQQVMPYAAGVLGATASAASRQRALRIVVATHRSEAWRDAAVILRWCCLLLTALHRA
ncbi:hypothetical protein CHLRE_05g236375v5 [Chlamydomonas reinhardtii]|uniref:Uncharacterized protein n=1 Tax=Chlamydomonas reinhardtii TaxID=3055 RepID=A0A2K3DSU6_CHLRE|nr:uncharacterized protein CHLRE_05g236375v5 [Chlamydomonas reinhardtii]PNW83597.1 hypothetical protein CHLRE_05g236375v5 [Chlamydomonas reinhardtii]